MMISREELAHASAQALLAEGRCSLTLSRSSQGNVCISIRTHALGMIQIEMCRGDLEDMLFGIAEVTASISKARPSRKPTYPES